MELVITVSSITIRLSIIYRMPPVKSKNGLKQGTFCNDFNDYLEKCKQPLESISKLNSRLADISWWMITNKLMINDSKTKFIVFRSPQLKCDLSGLSVNVGGWYVLTLR